MTVAGSRGKAEAGIKKELKQEKGQEDSDEKLFKKELSIESVKGPVIGNEVKAAMVRDLFHIRVFLKMAHHMSTYFHLFHAFPSLMMFDVFYGSIS